MRGVSTERVLLQPCQRAHRRDERGEGRGREPGRAQTVRPSGRQWWRAYFGVSCLAASAACRLRWSQLYLRWNFSTRPVVSTYFILPVKNGWQAEQISTVMFFRVLRVTNLLPQPHVTVASTYCGWMLAFIVSPGVSFIR